MGRSFIVLCASSFLLLAGPLTAEAKSCDHPPYNGATFTCRQMLDETTRSIVRIKQQGKKAQKRLRRLGKTCSPRRKVADRRCVKVRQALDARDFALALLTSARARQKQ